MLKSQLSLYKCPVRASFVVSGAAAHQYKISNESFGPFGLRESYWCSETLIWRSSNLGMVHMVWLKLIKAVTVWALQNNVWIKQIFWSYDKNLEKHLEELGGD